MRMVGIALLVLVACKEQGSRPATTAPKAHDAPTPAVASTPDAAPPPAPAVAPADKDAKDRAAAQAEAVKYAEDLITDDEPNKGTAIDQRHRPGADLGQQLDDVRSSGAQVKIGGGVAGPPLGTRGALDVDPGEKMRGRIVFEEHQGDDDTSLHVEQVLAKIQAAYTASLMRCYKDLLKRNPTAAGSATLEFNVLGDGRVDGAAAAVTSFDPKLTTCVRERLRSWRFPAPKNAAGDPVTAHFRFVLRLAPP
jgi:hypothetical protein